VARTVDEEGSLKWAVAGRSMKKVQNVMNEAQRQTGKNLEEVPILMADVGNQESLNEMCSKSKLVLNCVGPYRHYGQPVVQACVENSCNHIDISGEPGFLEKVQLLYNGLAKDKGIYIVGACGFDSIPCDLGVQFTEEQFEGDLNSVESYLNIKMGPEGGHGNIATWESAVYGYAFAHEMKDTRKNLFTNSLPRSNHKMQKRPVVFYNDRVKSWCIPFVGADRSIVARTQRYRYEEQNKRIVQMNAYMQVKNLVALVGMMLVGLIFGICSKFNFGRWLLLTFPKIMSLGAFSKTGPTRKQIEGASFTMTFVGKGYGDKIEDPNVQHDNKPDKTIVTQVTGPEVGYAVTPVCMVQAAYALLKETDSLPKGGGVFTAGGAFAKTNLIQRLKNHNVTFDVIQQ